jgi:hypothetical protein
MNDDNKQRKRIPVQRGELKAIDDKIEFTSNKCSNNARKIHVEARHVNIHLWFDKHYHNRYQHGDEYGKRENIGPTEVENLVRKAVKHLIFYSCNIRGFKFINYKGQPEAPVRVLLQEQTEQSILNVVIEVHYLDIETFEITVKTAMCVDDFRASVGQYIIEFQKDISFLKRKDNNTIVDIYSI